MGYSAALLQSVRHLSREALKASQLLAAVLIRVAMPIADTNPHSSMVDEDGNERVAESILLGTVSEDGRGHIRATSLLRGTARAISNVWPIPLQFATLRVRG